MVQSVIILVTPPSLTSIESIIAFDLRSITLISPFSNPTNIVSEIFRAAKQLICALLLFDLISIVDLIFPYYNDILY